MPAPAEIPAPSMKTGRRARDTRPRIFASICVRASGSRGEPGIERTPGERERPLHAQPTRLRREREQLRRRLSRWSRSNSNQYTTTLTLEPHEWQGQTPSGGAYVMRTGRKDLVASREDVRIE